MADRKSTETKGTKKVYTVVIPKAVDKTIGKLGSNAEKRVRQAIADLANDPRPAGYIQMKGKYSPLRFRVRTGDYRITYNIDDAIVTVTIVDADNRNTVYR